MFVIYAQNKIARETAVIFKIFWSDKYQLVGRVQIRTALNLAPAFKRGLSAKLTGGVVAQQGFCSPRLFRATPLTSAGGQGLVRYTQLYDKLEFDLIYIVWYNVGKRGI